MSSTVKNYLSLIKFSHTIFAMPFALIGFFIGIMKPTFNFFGQMNLNKSIGWNNTKPISSYSYSITPSYGDFWKLGLVVLCMIFARSAAMAFNRWADVKWDILNPRTAIREIPKGIITSKNALAFVIVSCVLFVTTTFFINQLCFFLSPIALLVVLGYSYTKRFTALCHLVLGIGLSLAPIGAYIAVTGHFDILPILFSFAVVFWVSGFDIIYACQDEGFDKSHHLHSIPAALGKKNALHVSEILHLISAACVVSAGFYGHFGFLYWIGVAIFAGMLVYQHSIVKHTDLSKVNIAFMTANGIASVVFAVFVIADLFTN